MTLGKQQKHQSKRWKSGKLKTLCPWIDRIDCGRFDISKNSLGFLGWFTFQMIDRDVLGSWLFFFDVFLYCKRNEHVDNVACFFLTCYCILVLLLSFIWCLNFGLLFLPEFWFSNHAIANEGFGVDDTETAIASTQIQCWVLFVAKTN